MSKITVQDQYIDLQEGRIFVRNWFCKSSINKMPIILMHDSLGSVELWRNFPQELVELLDYPVLAYDRLGFGLSSVKKMLPPLSFARDEANVYFPQIIKALGLDEFMLIGHSVGGGMSLLIAASHVKECRAVISISAQAFVEQRTVDGVREAKAFFQNAEQFQRLTKWHGEKAQWVLDAWTESWLHPDMQQWSLEPEIMRVECPVLAIHGEDDEYGSVAFPEMIVDKVSGYKQIEVLSDCGHMPHREQKETVLKVIQHFLTDI